MPENTNPTPTPAPAPNQTFSPACLAAVKAFRTAKPWRGNIEERKAKFEALHMSLNAVYNLTTALAFSDDIDPLARPGTSRFDYADETITLHNKLSVVTYLTAFAFARGFEAPKALRWATELYKRMFPVSASRHVFNGDLMIPIPAAPEASLDSDGDATGEDEP